MRSGAHLGVAVHVTVPDKTPSEHEYVPPAVWTYPVLHEGMHESPLARLDVHVPKAPFVGAVIVQGLGLQPTARNSHRLGQKLLFAAMCCAGSLHADAKHDGLTRSRSLRERWSVIACMRTECIIRWNESVSAPLGGEEDVRVCVCVCVCVCGCVRVL